jgi:hypothetical protein
MLLSSSFFLSGVWLVKAEGVCIGPFFMLGRTGFVLVVDLARARCLWQFDFCFVDKKEKRRKNRIIRF